MDEVDTVTLRGTLRHRKAGEWSDIVMLTCGPSTKENLAKESFVLRSSRPEPPYKKTHLKRKWTQNRQTDRLVIYPNGF